jgi:DNA-directed RNA polymerase subunit RPC12/RpoP
MLARIKCWFGGHQRGKRDAALSTQTEKVYRCPRCSSTWSRKVSAKA